MSTFIRTEYIEGLFSETEIKVAKYIMHGHSITEVAKLLDRSPATVRTHTKNIKAKIKEKFHMNFPSIVEAIEFVKQLKLV